MLEEDILSMTIHSHQKEGDERCYTYRLMSEKTDAGFSVEIICDCEPILASVDRHGSMVEAITEFYEIFSLLKGDALFLGPDNLDYPKSVNDFPPIWKKIAWH